MVVCWDNKQWHCEGNGSPCASTTLIANYRHVTFKQPHPSSEPDAWHLELTCVFFNIHWIFDLGMCHLKGKLLPYMLVLHANTPKTSKEVIPTMDNQEKKNTLDNLNSWNQANFCDTVRE